MEIRCSSPKLSIFKEKMYIIRPGEVAQGLRGPEFNS